MNEQTETIEHSPVIKNGASTVAPYPENRTDTLITPQTGGGTCGCSGGTSERGPNDARMISYVYAIGRIEARFPNLAAEKEFAQLTQRTDYEQGHNQKIFQAVLSKPENRYLARQLCWVLSIQGLETYLLLPRDPADISLLVESIRPAYSPNDIDVVIGLRGPIAPPEMCNGLMLPIIGFDQIYSFDRNKLIDALPPPDETTPEQFRPAAEELFDRIMQLTDNAGATDEHRALNYLSMRYPDIYTKAAEKFAEKFSLTGVEVCPSPLNNTRKSVDVIFAYTNRTDYTEKFYVRVDVTEEFPFLVTKMSPYFDREIGGLR